MENLWKTYGKLETSRKMMWPYQTVEQFLLIASFELIVPQAPKQKRSFTSWFVPRLEF